MTTAHASSRVRQQEYNGVTWIDAERPSAAELQELERHYQLHPVHVKESLHPVQHIDVEREQNYLFFVLHVPIAAGRDHKIVVNQVGIFLGKDYLIIVRSGSAPFVTELFETAEQQPEQAALYYKHGAASLLYTLINRLLGDITTMTDDVMVEIDGIEDAVFDDHLSDAQRISQLRQKIVRLSRLIGSKRFVLHDLAEQVGDFTGLGTTIAKYYASNTKIANRLWEVIGEAKETVEIYKDADFITSTERTNKILAVLTLLFTLTIPITVVGSLYGMNVPLPGGVTAQAWTFLGRYTTFGVVLAASVLVAGAMYAYFHKKHWF